jgi:type IV pilus assembly protein PilF
MNVRLHLVKATLWVALFLLVGCAGASVKDQQKAIYHMQNGSGLLVKGNYPGALAEFLAAKELDPKNPIIHNQLGLGYFFRGNHDLAEMSFRHALNLKSKFTEARNNLGRTLIELKRYREAVQELKIAAKDLVYGEPEKTFVNLGLAYFNLQDYQNAEKQFFEALKYRRQNCVALSYYGRSLYELSSYDQAAASLDQAIEVCKEMKFEDPYYFSAMSYVKIGERDQAAARLEKGLVDFPQGQFAAKARSMLEFLK